MKSRTQTGDIGAAPARGLKFLSVCLRLRVAGAASGIAGRASVVMKSLRMRKTLSPSDCPELKLGCPV